MITFYFFNILFYSISEFQDSRTILLESTALTRRHEWQFTLQATITTQMEKMLRLRTIWDMLIGDMLAMLL